MLDRYPKTVARIAASTQIGHDPEDDIERDGASAAPEKRWAKKKKGGKGC